MRHAELSTPDQGSNPGPPPWEHGVLPTGPPGKSLLMLFSQEIFNARTQDPSGAPKISFHISTVESFIKIAFVMSLVIRRCLAGVSLFSSEKNKELRLGKQEA